MNFDLDKELSYKDCKNIYDNWSLGKRFVNALPNYAMSSKRIFTIGDAPPEVAEKFKETCSLYNIDSVVKKCAKIARIYGLSAIFVACNKDSLENLTIQDLQRYNIRFNVLDPLNLSSLNFSQDPLNLNFQKPTSCVIQGKQVGDRRFVLCMNDMPLYIDFEASNLNFAGKSVYKNMRNLINLWDNLYDSLEKIALKASSIVVIGGENSGIFGGNKLDVTQKSLEILKQMRQGNIAWFKSGTIVEFFNLNGVTEIANMIENVRDAFTMALSDTPISILMDKNLSSGLNEGEADFKSTIMAVNAFREEVLNPLYNFLDSFMKHLAWSDYFVMNMKLTYPKLYNKLSIKGIRNKWINDFKFEWEELYPPSPDEINKQKTTLLDNLLKIKELGGDTTSLIKEINESGFFSNTIMKAANELETDFRMDSNTQE